MSGIHPAAVVAESARIGRGVEVGPLAIIEDGVVIGDGCRIAAHAVVKSGTTLGPDNELFEHCVVGGRPQHLKAAQDIGTLEVGRGNIIREHVTIHCGLDPDSKTTIGDRNMLMVGCHVAHDCHVGNQVIIVNGVLIGGHVEIGDRAMLGGGAAVHQFARIGSYAMVGGHSSVRRDVPPYVTIDGDTNRIVGLNVIGLRRAGFTASDLKQLKAAYQLIYRRGMLWDEIMRQLPQQFPDGPAAEFHRFFSGGTRGFLAERSVPKAATLKMHDPAAEAA